MKFLLDTMVVSYFFAARRHAEFAAAAGRQPCAIAEDVHRELVSDPRRGTLVSKWFEEHHLEVLPVFVASEADQVLTALSIGLTTKRGRGERASIALAAADPGLTLVTMDKNAMWIALRELWACGERLIGLSVFLRRLVDAGALEREAAADVMTASSHPPPSWWSSWISNAP